MSRSIEVIIDINGIHIEGEINLAFSTVKLEGEITPDGYCLTGSRGFYLDHALFSVLSKKDRPGRTVSREISVTSSNWGVAASAILEI